MSKKSATGIGEMLGNLMNSPAFAETAARMDGIQTQRPHLSVVVSPVTVPDPIVDVSEVESGPERLVDAVEPVKPPTPVRPLMSTSEPTKKSILFKGQSKGLTDGQTGKRADGLTSGASIELYNGITDSRTVEQSNGLTVGLSDKPTNELLNGQTTRGADKLTDGPSGKQPLEQTDGLSIEQSVEHVIERPQGQSSGQSSGRSARSIWAPLTENQGRILVYLFEVAGGLTNVDTVSADTVIAYGTVRKSIEVLIKEGYILEKRRFNGHAFNGFEYTMNNHLCSLYISCVRGEQSQVRPNGRPNGQLMGRSDGLTIERTITPFSSKVLEKNLNLTTNPSCLDDPELGYWKERGVNSRQVEKWAEEFAMEIDLVLQSLKHCRYEMIVLNHEEEKKIENPVNWFYRIMQRTGLYPRPANYKSIAEIRAEAMERAAKEMADARVRQVTAEKELAFQKLLTDPGSVEYQALYDQVSSFAKDEGNEALIFALRDVFFS